jgi:putative tricarboxylic transport membrane protein
MRNDTLRHLGDLALAAFVIAGAVILFVGAADLPPPRFEPLGSAAMPRILGAIMVALALTVAARAVLRLRGATPPEAPPLPGDARESDPWRGAVVLVALIAYVAALDFGRVPFVYATTAFVTVAGLAMGRVGLRSAAFFAALGLGVALTLGYVFETYLYIRIG